MRARDRRRRPRGVQQGDTTRASECIAKVHRLRPLLNPGLSWLSVQNGLELTRVHLALGEPTVAAAVLSEAEAILRVRPGLGVLADQRRELRARVTATSTPSGEWALSLTAAELRLLPLLTTHLAFPQIGERLFLSRTTIKTRRSRSTASSASLRAPRRSSAPSSSGCWRTRCTPRAPDRGGFIRTG